MSSTAPVIVRRSLGIVAMAALATGCSIDKSSAPTVSAPSVFGLSLTSTASPDELARDGQSTSLVRFSVRDYQDKAVSGQRLVLSTSTGTLSSGDVTTDSTGIATVRFTAPSINTPVSSATITATPVGSDLGTVVSGSKIVTIALAGPSIPTALFTFTPGSAGQADLVTFDASGTQLDGSSCLDACTYTWDFGDGSTASGRIASHRFGSQGSFTVRLNVAGPGGSLVSTSRAITIGAPLPITADITQSPTDAKVNDTIYFDASGSRTPDGTAIVSWTWDFGNGLTANTKQATTSYGVARTYTVRLTIVDALGRTATTTKTVSVS